MRQNTILNETEEELEALGNRLRESDSLTRRVEDLEKTVDLLSSIIALLSQAEAYRIRKHGKK